MIEIVNASKDDDFKQIAEYFFYTDPYIFPYMFDNVKNCRELFGKVISSPTGAFSYKNCVLAKKDNEIVGVALYLSNKTDFGYDYSWLAKLNEKYEYTIQHYISKMPTYIDNGETYIAMIFIKEEYRKHHIATDLLKHIFEISGNKKFKLHVLKENMPALCTYSKLDFKIVCQVKGFNGKHMKKPEVYEMIKDELK